jgi:hypothetical protein
MRDRQSAKLEDLCPVVWEEDCADVSPSARDGAIHKANQFLRKRQFPRMLEKARGEPVIRWV